MPDFAVLCGGLGGSRLVDALGRAAGPAAVTAVVNVGDDLEFLGLQVSPDLDTVLYTLAGLLDEERGWGVREETTNALATAERLGGESWFTLGDRDIGLHLVRTAALRAGEPLSAVTARLAAALGVETLLLPASDDRIATIVATPGASSTSRAGSWAAGTPIRCSACISKARRRLALLPGSWRRSQRPSGS